MDNTQNNVDLGGILDLFKVKNITEVNIVPNISLSGSNYIILGYKIRIWWVHISSTLIYNFLYSLVCVRYDFSFMD